MLSRANLLTLLVAVLAAALTPGCGRTNEAPRQTSPDGTMTLVTTISQSGTEPTRFRRIIVGIHDAAGTRLYQEMTPATETPGWSIRWVSNDEVLLDGTDVGRFHVRRQPGGIWQGELEAK